MHIHSDRFVLTERVTPQPGPGGSQDIRLFMTCLGSGRDVLSPLDLERIFGLHKGNIFHGALSLHQVRS